jgi:hypothetical protein
MRYVLHTSVSKPQWAYIYEVRDSRFRCIHGRKNDQWFTTGVYDTWINIKPTNFVSNEKYKYKSYKTMEELIEDNFDIFL